MSKRKTPGYIAQPWNQILATKHQQLAKVQRAALGTLCDPTTRKPRPRVSGQFRRQLKFIQINAALAGDNIIIPALAGMKLIYEMVMWNVTGQTIIWQQGLTGASAITQMRITDMPSLFGFTLGFNGSSEEPHWEIDNGQPLVLNLSGGTQVDGFIRYRVQNGTED